MKPSIPCPVCGTTGSAYPGNGCKTLCYGFVHAELILLEAALDKVEAEKKARKAA